MFDGDKRNSQIIIMKRNRIILIILNWMILVQISVEIGDMSKVPSEKINYDQSVKSAES